MAPQLASLSSIGRSPFAAHLDKGWRAVSAADGLRAWFADSVNGVIAPGQAVRMKYEGQEFSLIIQEVDEPRRLSWLWHPGAIEPDLDYSDEAMTE